jgi:PAS domain S-box-containing protein
VLCFLSAFGNRRRFVARTMKEDSPKRKPRAQKIPAARRTAKTPTPDPAGAGGHILTSEQSPEERLRFETLLSEISARFINLPADRIDSEIESFQRRICEFLDLDRLSLWQAYEGNLRTLHLTHVRYPSGSLPPPERMNLMDFFPWTRQKVLGGETVVISKMTDLPPEAGRDRETFHAYGTTSLVTVPLSVEEGPVFGLISFAVMREGRIWSQADVARFKLIAQVVANALARKRADQALAEAHGRLAATVAAIPDLMFEADVKGRIYAYHAPAAEALYAQPEAFLGKLVEDVLPPEAAGVILEALARAATEGAHRGASYALDMPGGRRRFELSIATKPGESEPAAHFVALVRDITERTQAEEALTKIRHLLAETEKIGSVGGWEIDLDTMKQTWTQEIYSIHEVDPTYVPTVEKGIQFYTPASRPVIERLVRRAIERGEPFDVELEIITAQGNLRSVHAIGRADLEHRRVYGFFRDITAQKQNEREMAHLRLELTHLSRVLTLNEISGSLAHEINQPLCAILNNAEVARTLLTQEQDKREDMPEIINDIIQDAKRAGDVVSKLRRLVKKGAEAFEPLPINALIDDVLALLRSSLTANKVTLRLDLKPDLPNISGDRVRLQQVLLNLVTNALDAMKETPTRILTVRSATDGPDTILVSVGDVGPGVAEARRASLFQPFFTTKKDGLGLGLSICRSIIEEHGGRIWETDNPGGGATFSFSLKACR